MNLIDIYVYEVKKWLPEKSKDEIAKELKGNIEDMLPDDYKEDDVKDVLNSLGDPKILAANYSGNKRYIIGPLFYDSYIKVLLIAMAVMTGLVLLEQIISGITDFLSYSSIVSFLIHMFTDSIIGIIQAAFQVFTWVTITFIFIDKVADSNSIPLIKPKWTTDQLQRRIVQKQKYQIPKSEAIFGLLWTIIWILVLLFSQHLLGWYETENGELVLKASLFNQSVLKTYIPLLIALAVLEISLAGLKYVMGKWTYYTAIFYTIQSTFVIAILYKMLYDTTLYNSEFIERFNLLFEKSTNGTFPTSLIAFILAILILFSVFDCSFAFYKAYKTTNSKRKHKK